MGNGIYHIWYKGLEPSYDFSYEEHASDLAKIYSAIDPARRWMTVGADCVMLTRVARRTMEHVESVTKSDTVVKSVKKETNA